MRKTKALKIMIRYVTNKLFSWSWVRARALSGSYWWTGSIYLPSLSGIWPICRQQDPQVK